MVIYRRFSTIESHHIATCIKSNVGVDALAILVICKERNAYRPHGQPMIYQTENQVRPQTVIATPVIFTGVNSSPKNQAEIVMVETSLAIPAMDIGRTPAR